MMEEIEVYLQTPDPAPVSAPFSREAFARVQAFHAAMPEYQPTPLLALPALAAQLGVGGLYLKDESKRFGLNAFKALGASYAIDALGVSPGAELVTATDGNHGKGVAWSARRIGCRATVFMPKGSAPARVAAIRAIGGQVTVTEAPYDDTVRMAASYAASRGAHLVQDTAFDSYTKIPTDIMLGYSTMAAEAADQLGALAPTHVFLQAGVGSMAAGVLAYLQQRYPTAPPHCSVLEAWDSACILESVRYGSPVALTADQPTMMAGLNCGEVSTLAFPILRHGASAFFRCRDTVSARGMRQAARPLPGDPAVVSGECGAIGLGVLLALMTDPSLRAARDAMKLGPDATVLLFSTEGDTNPEQYRAVLDNNVSRDSCAM